MKIAFNLAFFIEHEKDDFMISFSITIRERKININIKQIIDAVTILVLAAAFVICMVYGFLKTDSAGRPVLSTSVLAGVSIAGPLLLVVSGSFSSFLGRIKFSLLTKTFTYIFTAQAVAFIGILSVILSVLLGMFEKGSADVVLSIFYIIFAMAFVVGYAESVFVSEPIIAFKQAEADEALLESDIESEDQDDGELSSDK